MENTIYGSYLNERDTPFILISRSSGEYTLLLHSDVALLSKKCWPLLKTSMRSRDILVSPEDIGLGNYDRLTMGAGMPESSFMFWKTKEVLSLRSIGIYENWHWKSILRRPQRFMPKVRFDFYGPHITHNIPKLLSKKGCSWHMMNVHPSRKLTVPWFLNNDPSAKWIENDWGYREYGFGNFYSINGQITHYHNWFSRDISNATSSHKINSCKVPMDYIRGYTERFLKDFEQNKVNLPSFE